MNAEKEVSGQKCYRPLGKMGKGRGQRRADCGVEDPGECNPVHGGQGHSDARPGQPVGGSEGESVPVLVPEEGGRQLKLSVL